MRGVLNVRLAATILLAGSAVAATLAADQFLGPLAFAAAAAAAILAVLRSVSGPGRDAELWLCAGCAVVGGWILQERASWLAAPFLAVGYAVLVHVAVRSVAAWRDALNPLAVLAGLVVVRFAVPGMLLAVGAEPRDPLFGVLDLHDADWLLGHVLALTGALALCGGWLAVRGSAIDDEPMRLDVDPGGARLALGTAAAGGAALLAFVGANTSIAAALRGAFRQTVVVREGTGVLFYVSLLLIPASVTFTAFLLARGRPLRRALLPVLVVGVAFALLGGRARAMAGIAAAAVLVWSSRRWAERWMHPPWRPALSWAVVGVPAGIWIAYFGQVFRGGAGLVRDIEPWSIGSFWEYVRWAVSVDVGQLYAFAATVTADPGAFDEPAFLSALTWPIWDAVGGGSSSPGVWLVERTAGFFGGRPWGFATGIVGDAYLDWGVWAVLVVPALLGAAVKMAYVGFRRGALHGAVYALVFVYAARLFLEGIEKWPEALVVVGTAAVLTSVRDDARRPARAVRARIGT